MPKTYVLSLNAAERERMRSLARRRETSPRAAARIKALLACADESSDEEAAEESGLHSSSVERLRKRACLEGWEAAVGERPRSGRPPDLDAKQQAVLVALACEQPSDGRRRWSLRRLGERLVALEVVETISHETVRRILKKTRSSPGRRAPGASPK